MMKDVERYKIQKGLNNKEEVFAKQFSGATVEDMKNDVILSKKHENDLVILRNERFKRSEVGKSHWHRNYWVNEENPK